MPSRKRNKGRDRKAKKAALEAERVESETSGLRSLWQGWARGKCMVDGREFITPCNHGGALIIPNDKNHPVCSFVDTLILNTAAHNMHTLNNMYDTFQRHTEVWKNESYRKLAIQILVHIGTNSLLCNDSSTPKEKARAIVILENYDGTGDIDSSIYNNCTSTKLRDIHWGLSGRLERDTMKFYRKRTACSCLKKMHLEARKTLPKLGICFHCNQVKERALLMVCSRCRIAQYCSRECQIAQWPMHKKECDLYVRFRK